MDTEAAIHARLAMMLDENPRAFILITGRYMPGVRDAYQKVRHALAVTKVRQTVSNGGHIKAVSEQGGRLEAIAPYGSARGLRPNAVLYVGEAYDSTDLMLDSFGAGGVVVYRTLGV